MELGLEAGADEREATVRTVILLDTNALIWLEQGRPRARTLQRSHARLFVSPATLLELAFLLELGHIRLRQGTLDALTADDRWIVDDPPAASWFMAAIDVGWTRDPFDRLLVAHARIRKWRLATADARLIARLDPAERLEI